MSNVARGVHQQLRAHDRALEKASNRVREAGVERAKANAALAVRRSRLRRTFRAA